MLHSPVNDFEAKRYYVGLPSSPVLVARTGTPWEAPSDQAYRIIKELRPVGNHAIQSVWEDNLAFKLHALLDSKDVKWTSTDVVRIGTTRGSSSPVILWIGVVPASLSRQDGAVVASKCQELLARYDIADVDIEIRESVITSSRGPKLPLPLNDDDSAVDLRLPLTPTLGHSICAESTPWVEGTGGFFITEGGKPGRLLLVTARHVVLPPDENKENKPFKYKNNSEPRHNVVLFGDAAFTNYLETIKDGISLKEDVCEYQEARIKAHELIKASGEGDLDNADNVIRAAQENLKEVEQAKQELIAFHQDVLTRWAPVESRILGHVILSPPINIGSGKESYTEDWAIIEIDSSKIDASNFRGNAIDLGTLIPSEKFKRMMYPNHQNPHSFTYPGDRLLRLRGTIPDEEMRKPKESVDQNFEECLMVIKRGNSSGLTVGRANDIRSYTRKCFPGDVVRTSKEWAILPRSSKSGPFSDHGDSGAVIVDGRGRIGGLLTCGAGSTESTDITYATPISFLLDCMRASGLHKPNINPVLAA